jgi:hypothetical protein
MLVIIVIAAIVCVLAVPVVLGWWSLARRAFRYPDEERKAEPHENVPIVIKR